VNVLVIDIGGASVTGPDAKRMVARVMALAKEWRYDVVSIRCPGVVTNCRPAVEPRNLGTGWVNITAAQLSDDRRKS